MRAGSAMDAKGFFMRSDDTKAIRSFDAMRRDAAMQAALRDRGLREVLQVQDDDFCQ